MGTATAPGSGARWGTVWVSVLGTGVLSAAMIALVPAGWAWIPAVVSMFVGSASLVAFSMARGRPALGAGWYIVLSGIVANAVAAMFWYPSQVEPTSTVFVPFVHASFLFGSLAIVLGMASLMPPSDGERATSFLDALIVAIGAGIVFWGVLIGPFLDSGSLSAGVKLEFAMSLLVDLMLLAMFTRFVLGVRLTPATTLLGVYIVAQLAADCAFGYATLHGASFAGRGSLALWTVAFSAIAAALLHPSLRSLAGPTTRTSPRSRRRAWVIALAAISGPLVIVLWPGIDEARQLSIVALGLFGLVFFRLSGLMVDVDRYRQAQQDLRTADARFRSLVEQAPIVVYEWEFGVPGRWRYVSPRIHGLLGYTTEEYMADPDLWFAQVHEDDRELVIASEARSQTALEGETLEYRMRDRTGKVVWVRDEALVFANEDGPPYFRGILSDITAQKGSERALASLNADLERRVADRTAALVDANVELATAKEEAERASLAKSEFLSRASHELRTPLNAILGFGQLLELSPLDDRDKDRLAHIMRGGRHLLRLINEVLDISKVQAGNLPLSIEPVSIDDVTVQAIASVEGAAETKGVLVETAGSSATLVLADGHRLCQVLVELLSNAIQRTAPGGTVGLDQITGDGETRIRVVDTGPHVEDADLARSFAVFDRAGSPDPKGEVTGLGLALSKALVEAMGGAIGAESEVGTGMTVWLTLPTFVGSTAVAPARPGPAG